MDYYWKIASLVGTIIFAISAFLPIWSVFGVSENLTNLYQNLGNMDWGYLFTNYPASAVGLLLLTILWPITLVLCIISIFRRKTALAAGVIGIICWAGAITYIAGANGLASEITYGAAIYVGFAGAIIMLIARYVIPKSTTLQPPQYQATVQRRPPPPPPP